MPHAIPMHLVRTAEAAIAMELRDHKNHLQLRRSCCLALGLYGLRRTEVINLVKRNHNAAAATLRVNTIKHGRPRVLELHPLVNRALTKVNSAGRTSAPLLCTRSGKPLSGCPIQRYSKWLAKLLRVPCSFHSLRHTAAVRLYNATKDVYAVQRFLGHATLAQTHVYLQSTNPVAGILGPNFDGPQLMPEFGLYTGPMDDETKAVSIRQRLVAGRLPPPRGITQGSSQHSRTAAVARKLMQGLNTLPPLERETILRKIILAEWPRDGDPPAETRGNNKNHPHGTTTNEQQEQRGKP